MKRKIDAVEERSVVCLYGWKISRRALSEEKTVRFKRQEVGDGDERKRSQWEVDR